MFFLHGFRLRLHDQGNQCPICLHPVADILPATFRLAAAPMLLQARMILASVARFQHNMPGKQKRRFALVHVFMILQPSCQPMTFVYRQMSFSEYAGRHFFKR
jgi:hypothetical protein